MNVFDVSLTGIRRLMYYLSSISVCVPDLKIEERFLNFTEEPTDQVGSEIVRTCKNLNPELFNGTVLVRRNSNDPILQGNESQLYDIESAVSITNRSEVKLGYRQVPINNVIFHTHEWLNSWFYEPLNNESYRFHEIGANAAEQLKFNAPVQMNEDMADEEESEEENEEKEPKEGEEPTEKEKSIKLEEEMLRDDNFEWALTMGVGTVAYVTSPPHTQVIVEGEDDTQVDVPVAAEEEKKDEEEEKKDENDEEKEEGSDEEVKERKKKPEKKKETKEERRKRKREERKLHQREEEMRRLQEADEKFLEQKDSLALILMRDKTRDLDERMKYLKKIRQLHQFYKKPTYIVIFIFYFFLLWTVLETAFSLYTKMKWSAGDPAVIVLDYFNSTHWITSSVMIASTFFIWALITLAD